MTDNIDFRARIGRTLADNAELHEALGAKRPDFELVKDLVRRAYEAETGRRGVDVNEIVTWLRNAATYNPRFEGLQVNREIIRWIMYPTIAEKFWSLWQRKCELCNLYADFPFIMFMLHTKPVSRQVPLQSAFKAAIKDYLRRAQHDFTDYFDAKLCVAITFVLPGHGNLSDADNLAKPLLDALEGYAYRNDRQIEHLDLLRFRSGKADAFIMIRIAGTAIAENLNVMDTEFNVLWVGSDVGEIDLSPYLA